MAHLKIDNVEDFQHRPTLAVDNFSGEEYTLFNKPVLFRDDYWLRHIHVKITDKCNANCGFCIEKTSRIKEDKDRLMLNLERLLSEMESQGLLATVSVTGGEPTLCGHLQEVLDLISGYDCFVTMNTNGRTIQRMRNAPEWINISKHCFDDSSIMGINNLTVEDLIDIKSRNKSKVRLQAVLLNNHLDTPTRIATYIAKYSKVADDFGFRQLIRTGNNYNGELLHDFRLWLFDNANFVEQVIQDYYVYDTWDLGGKSITTSFSDMATLTAGELEEDRKIFREVIVHPDGLVSGDWGRSTKVLSS